MSFKTWLYQEVRHVVFEDNPINLKINGVIHHVTGIDFKWEDFGQGALVAKQFIQEFPYQISNPGQVIINAGFFDGYWIEQLNPHQIHVLHQQSKIAADVDKKMIFMGENTKPIVLSVNPLNNFIKIQKESIKEPDGSPATFHPPYDKKDFLHWWDFTEVLDGDNVIKHAARIRT